ncbi:MAG: LCP family protein [Thermoflexales bacterium]|nr:LCP family protein [Thermoflexales bacterium]
MHSWDGVIIRFAFTAKLAAALLATSVVSTSAQVPEPTPAMPPPARTVRLPPNVFNIALLGVDKRPHRNFMNTDVIIIASVNPDLPAVTLLSIPRDTPVYIPGVGVQKINTAYAIGGPDLFKATIRYNFGLTIDHYAMVNFTAVVRAVDALGGVDVIVTCPLRHTFPRDPYYMGGMIVARDYVDTFTGEVWRAGTRVPLLTIDLPRPGVYALNGLQALAYVRARYGVPGGDVDRGRREQRLIRAMLAKVRQIQSPAALVQLYNAVKDEVETDLSLEALLRYALIANRLGDSVIRSFHLGGYDNAGVVLDPSLARLRANRIAFIERALNVSLNQHVSAGVPIEVLNGTGDEGFALAAADRLRELGFAITDVGVADRPYARTVILDHTTTKKGSPVPLLLRTFNLSPKRVVEMPRADGPRLTVIVGADFNPCYYAPSLQAAGSAPVPAERAAEVGSPLEASIVVTETQALSQAVSEGLSDTNVVVTATALLSPNLPASAMLTASKLRFVVPAGALVNVRSAPTLRARILARLVGGASGEIEGRSVDGKWLQVRLRSGRLAWINAAVVQVEGEAISATPVSDSQPALQPTAQPTPLPADQPFVVVPLGDVVNVRAAPSLNAPVIGFLRSQQRAPILGKSANELWWQVLFRGQPAWVNASVVTTVGNLVRVPVVQ